MTETHWAFIHPFQLRLQRGIEVYLWNLTSALAEQGVRVDILTWAGPLNVPDYARNPGVKLKKVPSVRYYQPQFAVLYYVYWLLKGNYQHVFVDFAGYGEGLALKLARLVRPIPFSVVFHFPRSLVPLRYHEFEHWGFQRKATHLLAVSQTTAREVEEWVGRPCTVIGHGVDAQCFRPDPLLRAQVRQELGYGKGTPVLISVAALEERKGMQWVIRAMPELLKKNPDIHYLIVGDGQYRDNLTDLVANLALEEKVHFLGSKLDVRPYLCAADIMMILSRGEASSISLLEALACELPAITSDCPPFDEWVDASWGKKVDENNIEMLTLTISDLIKHQNTRTEMGIAGRAYVKSHHLWSQIAEQYIKLIEKTG